MPLVLAALLVVAAVLPLPAQQVAGGGRPVAAASATRAFATVWGQVRSESTGAPLRYAVVEVIVPGMPVTAAVTDSNGVYVLRDVLPGRRLLRATHFDHAPHEVEILAIADRTHPIDFDLEFRPVRLMAVTAEGARGLPAALDTAAATQADLGPATARVLETAPGVAELGLAEAARDVPGHEPLDPSDVLFVRGSAADLKLVLLNGVPVYAPFHVGGLIHALDADVLRSATLYIGGAPARYDGGLSYVMDLETRSARRQGLHGKLALDLLSARAVVEGPVGPRIGVLTSVRNVHGRGTPDTWNGDPFPYGYTDGLARVDISLGGPHVLTATGFWNDESVRLDTIGGSRHDAQWGNRAGSLRFRGAVGESELLVTAAGGQFRTTLPLSGVDPLLTEGTARRGRVALDVERQFAGGRVFWGGSADVINIHYRAYPAALPRDSALLQASAQGEVLGVYGEAAFTLLPRVRVRGGVRADYFTVHEGLRFTPRVSATVLLTDRAALTLMAGQYRQYVRTDERALVFLGIVPPDGGQAPALQVAEATHVVLALSQDLGEGMRLGLEGFYKEFTGHRYDPSIGTESSGVDVWVRRQGDNLNGWLGYSLAWFWDVDAERPGASQVFSGRQLVSAGVLGRLIGESVFDIRVSYGAGLPFTAIPEHQMGGPEFSVAVQSSPSMIVQPVSPPEVPVLPAEPKAPYIRIDAQVSRTWAGRWRSVDFELTPYLKVLNALNRRDAIFYHYNREAERPEPLAGLPIMPIVGAEWKF
jgi:hypothetical protein